MFLGLTSVETVLVFGTFSSLSLVMFLAGCAVGAWLARSAESTSGATAMKEHQGETARIFERVTMAAQRMRDLAQQAVSDIGEHSTKVAAINSGLQSIAGQPAEIGIDALLLTVGHMTCVNSDLQLRLTRLEQQIAAQDVELQGCVSEARTDSLTGLANRRAFNDEIQRRFAEWQRRRTPFALMMLDIDHFKNINDSLGHQFDDEALCQVGRIVTKVSRQMDFCCRYGGDEFVVVLPDTSRREAHLAAERIRKAIESDAIRSGEATISLTCSIGVAHVAANDDVNKLLRRADEALYKSKESGRNCGHWHDGEKQVDLSRESTGSAAAAANAPLIDSLANRQVFVEALQRRLPESQQFGIPLSVIRLQIDGYPAICDEHGQVAARALLDEVASFTQLALREIDLLARLEDEFAILLPGSTKIEANQIAKRLQLSAANCVAQLDNKKASIRLRLGIAEFQPHDSAESILNRAEEAAQKQAVPAATTRP
jgi:diguanylate cyclase